IRLGFVIVDDKVRGRGYGREMLSLAIQYAFDFVKVKKISLGVFENNIAAIKCYESCGFQRVKLENTECYHCMGEIWDCIEMEKYYR
ncbi:MAG: GNAT family N-acetyltransferase, partial [Lachnospiraceae bacterium]|nr:GNAT family N-acetyltransferase [Lachnospiraceae bacterium]